VEDNRTLGNKNIIKNLEIFISKVFLPLGYEITKNITIDKEKENLIYSAMSFSLNNKNIVYRKAKITNTRPGAFLTLWKRPDKLTTNTKPIALNYDELDCLIVEVYEDINNQGIFIFPNFILINKKIISTEKYKGKTAFRVFPPWSKDKGIVGTQVFSQSAKKTQSWQLDFFLKIDKNGNINSNELNNILNIKI